MKNKLLKGLVASFALAVSTFANAGLILREDFEPSAIDVAFDGGITGSPVYSFDILSVSGGNVVSSTITPLVGLMYTNNGDGGNPAGNAIRLDFGSFVSAIGLDVYYNNNPVLFELFNVNGDLIESITESPTQYGNINGYMGLNSGINNISYALISVPTLPTTHNLYIDNIIYQSVTNVPEPSTLAILAFGLMGLASRKFKKKA